eukprot:12068195-Alexandrium_andersonii.AAC.1
MCTVLLSASAQVGLSPPAAGAGCFGRTATPHGGHCRTLHSGAGGVFGAWHPRCRIVHSSACGSGRS